MIMLKSSINKKILSVLLVIFIALPVISLKSIIANQIVDKYRVPCLARSPNKLSIS